MPAVGGGFLRPEGFESPLGSSPGPSLAVPFRLVVLLTQIAQKMKQQKRWDVWPETLRIQELTQDELSLPTAAPGLQESLCPQHPSWVSAPNVSVKEERNTKSDSTVKNRFILDNKPERALWPS